MSADVISAVGGASNGDNPGATTSDNSSGGAGRGGAQEGKNGPLVVVQPPRASSPPRPAPPSPRANVDNTLRNGYAAISHSVSGETAAIGLGFMAAGVFGAIAAGVAAPVAVAAMMWRQREREHDENANGHPENGRPDQPGKDQRKPLGHQENGRGGKQKPKDPVLNKLNKGLDKLKPKKDDLKGKDLRGRHRDKDLKGRDRNLKGPDKDLKGRKGKGADGRHTTGRDGLDPKKLKDRKPKKDKDLKGDKDKRKRRDKDKTKGTDDGAHTTAPDGLDPKKPKGGSGKGAPELEDVIDAELVEDEPEPEQAPDVIDGEVVEDEPVSEGRIALVQKKRENEARRRAARAARKAAAQAARDGDLGDPRHVRAEVMREANRRINAQVTREKNLLALAAEVRERKDKPVNYPAVQGGGLPAPVNTGGHAIARRIDAGASQTYRILVDLADVLRQGFAADEDADMADHIVELAGLPNMCRNLATAVRAAAIALEAGAPLHRKVVKHFQNAAISALVAEKRSEEIMTVFVQAHREDILRVLAPRIGEERWNIRNAPGTLDGAKLRAAIASSQQRLALPAGVSGTTSGRLVAVADDRTRQIIPIMKGFDKGHMVGVLTEVNGAGEGVGYVADSIEDLVRRMRRTWPTESVVDDTVQHVQAHVRRVATELKNAVKAAKKAHDRELKLNERGRAGKGASVERKWDVAGGNRRSY